MAATLEAAKVLLDDGFTVLPYVTDDPVACQRLAAMGCAAVMPLAAPIGSGMGIRNPANLRIILETVEAPVIVDAGVGTASDAAVAMELGATAVLMNTAIALAKDPVQMAHAMRLGVEAGRLAYTSGRMEKRLYASASSPIEGTATFGATVRRASVALNGFKLDFVNADHHINIVEADTDVVSISGNKVTFRVECNYADKNLDDPYKGYVTALVIAEVG